MDVPLPVVESTITATLLATARVTGFVAVGSLPLGPGVPMVVRFALVWAMALAVVPAAALGIEVPPSGTLLLGGVLTELLIGGVCGLSVACITAAAGWAGGFLGSISGLSWADDFSNGPAEATTPLARLLWWAAAGAFMTAGGARVVLAGLLGSFSAIPLGTWLESSLASVLLVALGLACRLAVAVAIPAMVAVLAWHISAAIACRVLPLSPSAGLLQGSAALLLLLAVWTGGATWTDGIASAMTATCEQVFDLAVLPADAETP